MTLYYIIRTEGTKTEFYFPRDSFHFDDWTSLPEHPRWNTSLVAIALHHAAILRERERIMGTERTVQIIAAKGNETLTVDETQFSYAGAF